MTGIRIGIIIQALTAMVTALAIAFPAGWKLAFVIICFIPFMMFMGMLQGKKQGKADQAKQKHSFVEQGGQVKINNIMISLSIDFMRLSFV
jgi:ABC-type bacteriocin/lantibiotic exporter with double-glycine peptidase domain